MRFLVPQSPILDRNCVPNGKHLSVSAKAACLGGAVPIWKGIEVRAHLFSDNSGIILLGRDDQRLVGR